MLSGGHYTGVVYCYILSITCINSTICNAEWWPLYWCGLLLYICNAEWWPLYWCGLLLYNGHHSASHIVEFIQVMLNI
jgi:hypothetical protein